MLKYPNVYVISQFLRHQNYFGLMFRLSQSLIVWVKILHYHYRQVSLWYLSKKVEKIYQQINNYVHNSSGINLILYREMVHLCAHYSVEVLPRRARHSPKLLYAIPGEKVGRTVLHTCLLQLFNGPKLMNLKDQTAPKCISHRANLFLT